MSNETIQYWAKSLKNLNACSAKEEIKLVVGQSSICEAIYIPEVNEVVVLTAPEYVQLADTAEAYDYYIKSVVKSNNSSNAQAIVDAKEKLADFIKDEVNRAKLSTCPGQTTVTPLVIDDENIFIEVIELSSKKSSFVPRVLIESFRAKDKAYPLKPIASGSSSVINLTHDKPLKTVKGQLDRKNLKLRFVSVKTEISWKWDLVSDDPPLSGQLPSKYLIRLFGATGRKALESDRFNQYLDTFDTWVGEINKNLNWVYNDREVRKNKLVALIDPGTTSGEHQSPMLNDASILTHMQTEIDHIWGKSNDPSDIAFIKSAFKVKWSEFAVSLTTLAENCRKWSRRIKNVPTIDQRIHDPASMQPNKHSPGDKDYSRRKILITKLLTKANEVDNEHKKITMAKQSRNTEEVVFDEEAFGRVKNEVEYIWGQSVNAEDKNLVSEIKSKKWDLFAKNDETLIKNRKVYTEKIKKLKLPEYMFDASAQAQFMRYAFGATGSAVFDPLEGKFGLKAEGKADIALAEGKVNAKLLLPSNEGFNMTLPSVNKIDILKWESVDAGIPNADTFEHNKTFLLPDILKTLSIVTRKWSLYKNIYSQNKIQVIGHTDNTGTENYNDTLSKVRAEVAFELLTYNYIAWIKRFESKHWGDREIQIMLSCVLGQKYKKGKLKSTYWKNIVKQFQVTPFFNLVKTPIFPDVSEDCFVKNIARGEGVRGAIVRSKNHGQIGVGSPTEKETLRFLIQAYMQKGTGNRFLLESSFHEPKYIGRGESNLAIHTKENQREARNRRVEIHLLESTIDGTNKKVEEIPLGHIRLQIETYLTGYAGANVLVSAELGFSGSGGDIETKGIRKGEAKEVLKEVKPARNYEKKTSSTAVSHTLQNAKNAKYKVDNGLTNHVGAFLGAQATAGIKAILEWKCPEPEPVFKQPNKVELKKVPVEYCKGDAKDTPAIIEMAGFKNEFAELGSAGYSITGSAGIGLEGELQIGFDNTTGKFLFKIKAKLVCGLGAGGAFQFSIGARNVYWFVRFVHAQLNDHNFNFVNFMDEDAFEMFSVMTFELLKDGQWVAGSIVALGYSSMVILSEWQKIRDAWRLDYEKTDAADALAEQILGENFLFSYLTPQVKARVLYTLSHTSWYTDEEDRERAILKVLGTVASKNEYKEILEHLGPPLPRESDNDRKIAEEMCAITKREKEKIKRVGILDGEYAKMGTSEERLLSSLDDGWVVGGWGWVVRSNERTKFMEWRKTLPDDAPKMIKD